MERGIDGRPNGGSQLDTRSLSDRVTDTIRDRVLSGQLEPGVAITQQAVADELGVSIMPVREALMRLSYEGLIDARRARSFTVVGVTRQDVEDTFWIHAQLAGELTRRAVRNGVDVDKLAAAHEQLSQAEPLQFETMRGANLEFHRIVNHAAASPKLILVLRQTLKMIPESFYVLLPEWRHLSVEEHGAMLAAIKRGNYAAAGALAEAHVLNAGTMLLQCFNDRGWVRPGATVGEAV